jgi:hypothetical protein
MYTFQDHDGVFDERPASERGTYVLRVKDLAQEDKPREKLLRVGPTSMTNPELVAIIFGSGTTKEGVLEMAARVIKDYGERALAGQRDAAKLAGLVEGVALLLVDHAQGDRAGVIRGKGREAGQRRHIAVHADHGRNADLDVKVRGVLVEHGVQQGFWF